MARGWQEWLSPRPKRNPHPPGSQMPSFLDTSLYEFTYEEDGRFVVKERHYASNKTVREGKSGPPLHIHINQTEYFQVVQGTLAAVKDGEEVTLTKDDGVLEIPSGARHRFWAHTSINQTNEDLIFKVWTEPQSLDRGFDESFLRNIVGYFRDCYQQGLEPSIFAVCLFGAAADIVFICPPFWVPVWILQSVQWVIADVIGRRLLG
ncbi:hypothetical protein QBC43DRAFT_202645 [Cladorrhinum sp. PSN259]|nr:hypothetical protein QBC43DRAFT_202645 [Cladorrhinum sp. PSN259]